MTGAGESVGPWRVEVGSSDDYPDAPVGIGRLFHDGVYVGSLSLEWAIHVGRHLNVLERMMTLAVDCRFGDFRVRHMSGPDL